MLTLIRTDAEEVTPSRVWQETCPLSRRKFEEMVHATRRHPDDKAPTCFVACTDKFGDPARHWEQVSLDFVRANWIRLREGCDFLSNVLPLWDIERRETENMLAKLFPCKDPNTLRRCVLACFVLCRLVRMASIPPRDDNTPRVRMGGIVGESMDVDKQENEAMDLDDEKDEAHAFPSLAEMLREVEADRTAQNRFGARFDTPRDHRIQPVYWNVPMLGHEGEFLLTTSNVEQRALAFEEMARERREMSIWDLNEGLRCTIPNCFLCSTEAATEWEDLSDTDVEMSPTEEIELSVEHTRIIRKRPPRNIVKKKKIFRPAHYSHSKTWTKRPTMV